MKVITSAKFWLVSCLCLFGGSAAAAEVNSLTIMVSNEANGYLIDKLIARVMD